MALGGFFSRLKEGLSRSTQKLGGGITQVFRKRRLDDEALDELEDLLISADLGTEAAARVIAAFRRSRFGKEVTDDEIKQALAEEIAAILDPVARRWSWTQSASHTWCWWSASTAPARPPRSASWRSNTESAAYLHDGCRRYVPRRRGGAASGVGQRTGSSVIAGPPNADAAGLAFDALTRAANQRADVLLIDTAGRLHNKSVLMDELTKIIRVMRKQDPTAPHSVLLVLDATTGQNAIQQVKVFKEMVDVTGLVVTKLDGSARGGIVVALAETFGLPVHAVGVGEQATDLRPFDAMEFARGLVRDLAGAEIHLFRLRREVNASWMWDRAGVPSPAVLSHGDLSRERESWIREKKAPGPPCGPRRYPQHQVLACAWTCPVRPGALSDAAPVGPGAASSRSFGAKEPAAPIVRHEMTIRKSLAADFAGWRR